VFAGFLHVFLGHLLSIVLNCNSMPPRSKHVRIMFDRDSGPPLPQNRRVQVHIDDVPGWTMPVRKLATDRSMAAALVRRGQTSGWRRPTTAAGHPPICAGADLGARPHVLHVDREQPPIPAAVRLPRGISDTRFPNGSHARGQRIHLIVVVAKFRRACLKLWRSRSWPAKRTSNIRRNSVNVSRLSSVQRTFLDAARLSEATPMPMAGQA